MAEDNNIELGFKSFYDKVLKELDVLYRGVYDASDAEHTAALCLIAQSHLIPLQAEAEFRARAAKRDIEFIKAEAFERVKIQPNDNFKKITDALAKELVNKDEKVLEVYKQYNEAEKEAKQLTNILFLLKDAHITFRSLSKKEN